MADNWGLCKACKWWQIEPEAAIENTTVGMCIEKSLQRYLLRVSGNSGCNCFAAGKPHREAGSSEQPPPAVAMG